MPNKPRKDVVRNNRMILRAAGEILRSDPTGVTIAAVAERSGLSAPTVYRYYPSIEALLDRYMVEVLIQLRDYSHDCDAPGVQLFDRVLDEWGALVDVYGSGLVQLRSRRGFLERLAAADYQIGVERDAWDRPLRRLLRVEQIDDSYFESALFLYNLTFDPRELLDLRSRGLTMQGALGFLKPAFLGALRGWRDAGVAPVPPELGGARTSLTS